VTSWSAASLTGTPSLRLTDWTVTNLRPAYISLLLFCIAVVYERHRFTDIHCPTWESGIATDGLCSPGDREREGPRWGRTGLSDTVMASRSLLRCRVFCCNLFVSDTAAVDWFSSNPPDIIR